MNLQIQRQIAIYHNIERHIFSLKKPHQTKQTNQKGQKYKYEW